MDIPDLLFGVGAVGFVSALALMHSARIVPKSQQPQLFDPALFFQKLTENQT
jgi:hypothetical protein